MLIVFRIITVFFVIAFFILGIIDARIKHLANKAKREKEFKSKHIVMPLNNNDIDAMYEILVNTLCDIGAPGNYISYLNILYSKASKYKKGVSNVN
ncbi:MAG: hypothetical protein JXB50_12165 [Spirochaetes bacterium]|nr:hypothetical protein [Spirochaetota bacterium]